MHNELKKIIDADKKAAGITIKRPRIGRDRIWKFVIAMRKYEFYSNKHSCFAIFYKLHYKKLQEKYGVSIPINCFDSGFVITHLSSIFINPKSKIGKNCKIYQGVTIGTTLGTGAPIIGNNVFIGAGAKIIGDVTIADNVVIGANAVVVKSIAESGTTWGGVPACKISNRNSYGYINKNVYNNID